MFGRIYCTSSKSCPTGRTYRTSIVSQPNFQDSKLESMLEIYAANTGNESTTSHVRGLFRHVLSVGTRQPAYAKWNCARLVGRTPFWPPVSSPSLPNASSVVNRGRNRNDDAFSRAVVAVCTLWTTQNGVRKKKNHFRHKTNTPKLDLGNRGTNQADR